MRKIKSLDEALNVFVDAAIKHAEATKQGDYKMGNRNYHKKVKAVSYLKEHGSIDELLPYLNDDNVGVRLAAATYLLPKHEKEGVEVLENIAKSAVFFSFIAETTLSEWRKGHLTNL